MHQLKKATIFSLKILISLALVYVVVAKTGVIDFSTAFNKFGINFFLAVLCSLLFTCLKTWKWHGLVSVATAREVSLGEALKSYLVGLACGLLTPARVGEIARLLYLENHHQGLIACLVIMDRILDFVVVLFLSLAGLFYFSNPAVVAAAGAILAMLLLMFFSPAYPLRCFKHTLDRTGKFAVFQSQLGFVTEQIAAISPRAKCRLLALSFLSYAVVVIQFFLLLNNYHHGGLGLAVLVQPLVMLTNIFPYSIAGLGVREGTAMVLLSRFAVPRAAAVATVFMIFLINMALPALVGGILLFLHRAQRASR